MSDEKEDKARGASSQIVLEALFDCIPDLIFAKGDDGVYTHCNDAFSRFVGRSKEDIIGYTDYDLFPKRVADLFRKHDQEMLTQGSARHNDEWVTYPDGKKVLLDTLKTPFHVLDNQANAILGISRDITDYNKVKTDLDLSSERFKAALESTLDGFWLVDRQGKIVMVNEAYCRMSGYEAKEFEQLGVSDLDVHETESQRKIHMLKLLETGSELFETKHRRKDGSVWHVEVSISYSDVEGGCFFIFLRDISERKNKERILELRQKMSELVFHTEPMTLLRTALDVAEEVTASEIGFFHFVEEDEETVSLQTWSTRTLKEMCFAKGDGLHYPVSAAGVWVDCIRERKPIIHNDYPSLPHKKGMRDGHPPLQRELTVPIFRNGKIVAVVGLGNKKTDYDDNDLALVSEIADMAFEYSERKKAEEQIQFMAYNDVLTGLPNRQLLADRLHQAISLSKRSKQIIAVCFLDLDGFKAINDRFGHEIGDRLLQELAKRLQAELREGDTLARLGGDEFSLVLCGLNMIDDGEEVVNRILNSVKQPFNIDGHRLHVSASIGITYSPHDPGDGDALLRHADQAMYKAKEAGKNRFQLYTPIEEHKISQRLKALGEFKYALSENQLRLHYQPRISLDTGALTGVEALVRWQHPEKGLLQPVQFLPLLANTAYEIELDEWVIIATLNEHMKWRKLDLYIPVSINITPRHIQQKSFPVFLKELLKEYPKDITKYIEFEVLETAAIRDTTAVSEIMRECVQMGITFSLDDFGTGYSSLIYFHQLPVKVLKIDQHFVRDMLIDPADHRIVEGVLKLAETLNCPVVAEGVETKELGLMLHQLGCQYAQGYGIAKPMPTDQLVNWIIQRGTDEFWYNLSEKKYDFSSAYDLNVVLFSHRSWLEGVLDHVASHYESPCPPLGHASCHFSKWYHGPGRDLYGHLEHYPFILAKHDLMHELGERYVMLSKTGRQDEAKKLYDDLQKTAADVFEMLKKLKAD
ncbi:MAG: EAL domain-containing protein [Methylocystaceae bacterium]|nr:EAL domain-containing protein [Methylocystaceae bacterium]